MGSPRTCFSVSNLAVATCESSAQFTRRLSKRKVEVDLLATGIADTAAPPTRDHAGRWLPRLWRERPGSILPGAHARARFDRERSGLREA